MITVEDILSVNEDNLQEASQTLQPNDLPQLVEWLSQKDDKIRYKAFLLLKKRSEYSEDVYQYFEVFCDKLKSDNSYQRSIGAMLISANARWDQENKLDLIIDDYLNLLKDDKPITIRQCIQALEDILNNKPHLSQKFAGKLMSIDLSAIKETMRKIILMDILNILILIKSTETSSKIENYIMKALTGGILDKKAIKQIEAKL